MKTAKLFKNGRSQAVRLPKEFRLNSATVIVRRDGNRLVLEPADEWPEGYVESFAGVAVQLERPKQGRQRRRVRL